MTEKNTLRQVRSCDLYLMKDIISKTIDFYVVNCETITKVAEDLGDEEGSLFISILNLGLSEYQKVSERIEERMRQ